MRGRIAGSCAPVKRETGGEREEEWEGRVLQKGEVVCRRVDQNGQRRRRWTLPSSHPESAAANKGQVKMDWKVAEGCGRRGW